MDDRNFTRSFTVSRSPEAVFAAINDVRGWWSGDISGPTDRLGEAFDYRFGDMHRCRIEVTELVPGRRVAWTVLDNFFAFTESQTEWIGDRMVFEITPQGSGSEVRFTQIGLVPENECYEACSQGWGHYMAVSLPQLIETGRGQPNEGAPLTARERELSEQTAG